MSTMERNKGKLIPTGISYKDMDDEVLEDYPEEKGYIRLKGELYKPEYEIEGDRDVYSFCEVEENEDGTISFQTYHYNCCHWSELVEDSLEET